MTNEETKACNDARRAERCAFGLLDDDDQKTFSIIMFRLLDIKEREFIADLVITRDYYRSIFESRLRDRTKGQS